MLEASARRCSVKQVFSKILLNSHVKTCTGVSFLIKLQADTLFTDHIRVTASEPPSERKGKAEVSSVLGNFQFCKH